MRPPRAPARARAAAAAVLAAVTIAACGGGGGGEVEAPASTPDPAPEDTVASGTGAGAGAGAGGDAPATGAAADATADAAPTPDPTSAAPVTGVPLVDQTADLATGLDVPWDVHFLPDGTALVTLRDEARVLLVSPAGDVTPLTAGGQGGRVSPTTPDGEGGLLGVTADAAGEQVFVYVTTSQDNRVLRYDLDRATATLASPVEVVTGIPRFRVHNGGRIDIGPDGYLYIATGDARDRSAPPDPSSLAGKILRVTLDGQPAPGNPFPGSPVWSSGHRNVQGLGWSPDGTMWASEFGQDQTDELNVIVPGANYGWPEVEGVGGGPGLTDPVVTWTPDEASPSGITVTGDAVYVAALRGERLWRVPVAPGGQVTGEPEAYLEGDLGRLRHVEVAPDGSLWLLTSNTFRGDPRPGDDRIVRLPLG